MLKKVPISRRAQANTVHSNGDRTGSAGPLVIDGPNPTQFSTAETTLVTMLRGAHGPANTG